MNTNGLKKTTQNIAPQLQTVPGGWGNREVTKTKMVQQPIAAFLESEDARHASVALGRSLNRISREINGALDARVASQVSPELTGVRGMVLGYVISSTRKGKEIYQRDVETEFHINRSSVTALLQGLEQAGFINRVSVEQDARLKSLVPTEKGIQCHADLQCCIDAFEKDLRAGFSPAEIAGFMHSLNTLYTNVQNIRSSLSGIAQEE